MDLNYIFIKSVAASTAHYPSKLINKCFQEGMFPDSLKIASVIPLHRKSEKRNPETFAQYLSYQLLEKFQKVFLNRISNYFNCFEILKQTIRL